MAVATYDSEDRAVNPPEIATPVPNGTPKIVAPPAPTLPKEPLPASIEAFDELIAGPVQNFVDKSVALDELVSKQVNYISKRDLSSTTDKIYAGTGSTRKFQSRAQVPGRYNQGKKARH
jgi:hypothetical protein